MYCPIKYNIHFNGSLSNLLLLFLMQHSYSNLYLTLILLDLQAKTQNNLPSDPFNPKDATLRAIFSQCVFYSLVRDSLLLLHLNSQSQQAALSLICCSALSAYPLPFGNMSIQPRTGLAKHTVHLEQFLSHKQRGEV